jgi:hypothetical protein
MAYEQSNAELEPIAIEATDVFRFDCILLEFVSEQISGKIDPASFGNPQNRPCIELLINPEHPSRTTYC